RSSSSCTVLCKNWEAQSGPRGQARRHHLVEIAVMMVKGEVGVEEGLREIHRTVVVSLSHPQDLQIWCDLLDEFQRAPNGSVTILDPGKRDVAALLEAKMLAESWRR